MEAAGIVRKALCVNEMLSLQAFREEWSLLGAFHVCYFLQPSSCVVCTPHVLGHLTTPSATNPPLNGL